MIFLLVAAAAPVPPVPDQARRVIEWQLRSPPRDEQAAGLSVEEAEVIRQRYIESIGQRPPQSSAPDRRDGR
jgi:hypothetical protein